MTAILRKDLHLALWAENTFVSWINGNKDNCPDCKLVDFILGKEALAFATSYEVEVSIASVPTLSILVGLALSVIALLF